MDVTSNIPRAPLPPPPQAHYPLPSAKLGLLPPGSPCWDLKGWKAEASGPQG